MTQARKTWAFAIAFVAAGAVLAQPPGGGRRGFGGGGFGGGLGGSNGAMQIRLLELPDFQKELKFSDEDKAALPLLKDVFEEGDQKFRESLRELFQPGEAPDFKAMNEKNMARAKEIEKQLGEILGDRLKRFKEVRRQLVGINNALSGDPEAAEAIALTEDQQTQIREKQGEIMREMFGSFGGFGKGRGEKKGDDKGGGADKGNREEMRERGKKLREAQIKVYEDFMTDAQKAKWKELQGALVSFKLPDDFGFGQGGRDRGNRGKGDEGGGRKRKKGGDDPPPPGH
jgi:hypothetical protein